MIYVFLADGFEEIEALAPVDILRRGGLEVQTVGVTGKTVTGSHGIAVTADITVDETVTEGLCGVVLPGGIPGTPNLESNARVMELLELAREKDIITAAICAAPSILGHRGYLEGRKATCFPGFESELKGADVTDEPAVRDGNIITGRGAGAAMEFGFELLAAFKDMQTAEKLRRSMCCP